MRLVDLDPAWFVIGQGRHGMGVTFECPKCRQQRIGVWFANPLDGKPAAPADERPLPRWKRDGETFETLTLKPSIDASGGDQSCTPDANGKPTGHWHGFITDGAIT